MKGETAELGQYVSKSARGALDRIRTGKLVDGEADRFKKTFTNPRMLSERAARGGRQLNLQSETDNISLLVKKEGDAWKVAEMTITPKKK